MPSALQALEFPIRNLLSDLERVYTDVHAHPELSMQERHPEVYAEAKRSGRLGELPTNHNPRFAPILHPTLQAGVEALVVASLAWLAA